jgi:hypothetical protein
VHFDGLYCIIIIIIITIQGTVQKTYYFAWTVALNGNETATLVSSNKLPKHCKDWAIITATWLESNTLQKGVLEKSKWEHDSRKHARK